MLAQPYNSDLAHFTCGSQPLKWACTSFPHLQLEVYSSKTLPVASKALQPLIGWLSVVTSPGKILESDLASVALVFTALEVEMGI